MIPWHRVSVVDTQSGIGKLLTSFSWNLLIAKILYSLSKCKSCRLSINNCVVLSMLVAEIKWKQMNFTCQNKLVFVFLSCILVSNYVRSRWIKAQDLISCLFTPYKLNKMTNFDTKLIQKSYPIKMISGPEKYIDFKKKTLKSQCFPVV